MKSLVLFNNKGGVGKTTLTFNLAHMFARMGKRVLLLDFDPQCNLTSILFDEDELVDIWDESNAQPGGTVASCVDLVRRGKGGLRDPVLREVSDYLWCLPGDLSLSRFEQPLAEEPKNAEHPHCICSAGARRTALGSAEAAGENEQSRAAEKHQSRR